MNNELPTPGLLSMRQRLLDGFGCFAKTGHWLILAIILSDVFAILIPSSCSAFTAIQEKARLGQAASNARQIIIALKHYAEDHEGRYPDENEGVRTANDAFRVLFRLDLINDEQVFTAHMSPFAGDKQCGVAPGYNEALTSGENHWSMVAGLMDKSQADQALVFENSVNVDQWPPRWNCDKAGLKVEGRAWSSGRIVIGRNDGSVMIEKLNSITGDSVGMKDEMKCFPREHDGLRILDVAR